MMKDSSAEELIARKVESERENRTLDVNELKKNAKKKEKKDRINTLILAAATVSAVAAVGAIISL
tara:strand:+ start:466 stop:660 length:195 start_codon:yes stop_codon:yes gene_type:complete